MIEATISWTISLMRIRVSIGPVSAEAFVIVFVRCAILRVKSPIRSKWPALFSVITTFRRSPAKGWRKARILIARSFRLASILLSCLSPFTTCLASSRSSLRRARVADLSCSITMSPISRNMDSRRDISSSKEETI